MISDRMSLASLLRITIWTAAAALALGLPASALAKSRVTVAVTETIAGINPYADSVSLMNAVWCQVYGCMVRYNDATATYESELFESWKVEDPLTWVFKIKPGLKRTNGEPVVAEDIVHTINRMKTDPQSRQAHRVAYIKEVIVREPGVVVLKTTEPAATLLEYLKSVIVTSKAQWDKLGKEADKEAIGAGPYKLRKLVTDNYVQLDKDPTHPLMSPENPDELVFRIMKEPEQRVTALFNNEVQIAQFIPPQLVSRVEQNPKVKVAWNDSVEVMFVAMSPGTPPWDKKEVRQAVAYGIDRDAIIKNILQGQASRLDGPVGPGQIAYTPDLQPKYPYDPEKSKALLKQAGFNEPVPVDFYATIGRYTSDKQICEAIAAMLDKAGFKVNLKTPEWGTMWSNVQKGGVPFYYMGRGTVVDPSPMLAQYFETGVTPRTGYSNPEVDKMLAAERQTFDVVKRREVLQAAMSKITDEAPAAFMWRHKMAWGIQKNLEYAPVPTGDVWGWKIKVGATN
jgi:peptide/nickel transport system substrate-binding protein